MSGMIDGRANKGLYTIDQDGFLYTYGPTYDYMQTIIWSQLGAHDGLTLVMPAP